MSQLQQYKNCKFMLINLTREEAGDHLRAYEYVFGNGALKNAEPLQHLLSYRDPARLDNSDMCEGIVYMLHEGHRHAATMHGGTTASTLPTDASKSLWRGFYAFMGEGSDPMFVRVGGATRMFIPVA